MKKENGNFLLQALLAIALIILFIPFFTQKILNRDKDAQMYATTTQIETAAIAARFYLRENINSLNYDKTTINGDDFNNTLEPYGLPLGFMPRTVFGQKISLVINKSSEEVWAYLELSGGNLSGLRRAELAQRIGFYASTDADNIYVIVPLDAVFSDIVRRNEKNPEDNGFLSDLNMGGNSIDNISVLFAQNSEYESVQTNTLSLFGTENGKKIRSKIENLNTANAVFKTNLGDAPLHITRGTLTTESVRARTISKFGDSGNLTTASASVYDFSITAGRSGFTGPAKWDVRGNVITDNINFTTDFIDISGFINASHGSDVFVNPDDLEYSSKSGIETQLLRAANITLRDQTSAALSRGETGAVILDIRVAGTSVLPDILMDEINNDAFKIILNPGIDDGKTTDCKSIISGMSGVYNARSLSQNIICGYVFWQRLEQRIDIKKCMLDGKSDCDK